MTKDVKGPKIMKSEAERKEEWLNEEVSIEFMNLEEPGVPQLFVYGSTKNPKKYHLMHGGKYKLPRRVIEHIESRRTPIWNYRPNGIGGMEKELTGHKSRFQCRQLFE